jgi:acyl-CoA reductase-like NAD-dependent aldehyde dehydrogenase
MTEKAEADVKESIQAIEEYEKQIAELEVDRQEALQEVNERWEEIASEMTEIEVTPFKKDILVDVFGVAWFPYYAVRRGDRIDEIPGYGS